MFFLQSPHSSQLVTLPSLLATCAAPFLDRIYILLLSCFLNLFLSISAIPSPGFLSAIMLPWPERRVRFHLNSTFCYSFRKKLIVSPSLSLSPDSAFLSILIATSFCLPEPSLFPYLSFGLVLFKLYCTLLPPTWSIHAFFPPSPHLGSPVCSPL
jgi:hypothetical protein